METIEADLDVFEIENGHFGVAGSKSDRKEDMMKKTLRLGHIKLGLLEFSGPVQVGEMELERVLDNLVIFWIEWQSHRGGEFGDDGASWKGEKSNIIIASDMGPEWWGCDLLYVYGKLKDADDRKLLCTIDEWERIEAAVKEYNETEF